MIFLNYSNYLYFKSENILFLFDGKNLYVNYIDNCVFEYKLLPYGNRI